MVFINKLFLKLFLALLIFSIFPVVNCQNLPIRNTNSNAIQQCGFDFLMKEKMQDPFFAKRQKKLDSILSHNHPNPI